MTRPPIEELDRLHGEATAPRGGATDEERVTFCQRRFEEDVSASWPQVSEYIRGLEAKLSELRRHFRNASGKLRQQRHMRAKLMVQKRKIRDLKSALKVCREQLGHVGSGGVWSGRDVREAVMAADAALGDTDD